MAKKIGVRTLFGDLTLSAANTFTEVEVDLNLSVDSNIMLIPRMIELRPTLYAPTALPETVSFQVSATSQSGIAGIKDRDIISSTIFRLDGAIAAGVWLLQFPLQQPVLGEQYVFRNIWVSGSTGTAPLAVTFSYRIHTDVMKVTKTEFLESLAGV